MTATFETRVAKAIWMDWGRPGEPLLIAADHKGRTMVAQIPAGMSQDEARARAARRQLTWKLFGTNTITA